MATLRTRTPSPLIQFPATLASARITGDLSALSGEERDSFEALKNILNAYDLGSLAQTVYDFVVKGFSAPTIEILIQDTTEWKDRFAGNERRRQRGLAVLPTAQYLANESTYTQILRAADMPAGFYDQHSDFVDWIGKDVAPTEIQARVDLAVGATAQANPAYKQALQLFYGIGESDLVAYFLDENRALPILEKQSVAAMVGGAALRRGLSTGALRAEELATLGVDAEAGFQRVSEMLEPTQRLAALSRDTFTQREAEEEAFGLGSEALFKRRKLLREELSRFSGASGATGRALGRSTVGAF